MSTYCMFDPTIQTAGTSSSSLTSCFSVSLPAKRAKDDEQNRKREMDEWCSHYCSVHLSPGGERERERGSCNRPRYISGQMRGVWVLLERVCPEERNIRKQEEHHRSQFMYSTCTQFAYIINLLESVWSKSPAGEQTNCRSLTSLMLHSRGRRMKGRRFKRCCQTGWLAWQVAPHTPRVDRFSWEKKKEYGRYFMSVSQQRKERF